MFTESQNDDHVTRGHPRQDCRIIDPRRNWDLLQFHQRVLEPVSLVKFLPDSKCKHWVELSFFYGLTEIIDTVALNSGDIPLVTESQNIEDLLLGWLGL